MTSSASETGSFCEIALAPWWRQGDALRRFIIDLVTAETSRLRPGAPDAGSLSPQSWRHDLRLGEAGLGFDSLERLQLATALSEALHMHESGLADYLLARPTCGAWHDVAEASLERFSGAITVHTSGSTGLPKPCSHRLAELEREVDTLQAILTDRTRILSAVPCHHIYGFLFTILLPARLGVPLLDLRAHSPGALPSLMRPGDVIVGHPTFWSAALRAAPAGWPAQVTGVTSTAPSTIEIADALAQAGLSRLIDIHGSSETAGIGWRDNPRQPYQLMAHWRLGDDGRLLRDGQVGFEAPDRMEFLDAGRYRLCGRLDGAVQVGGINVFPQRVEELLGSHPAVANIAVRLMTSAEGQRLKAFVVPHPWQTDLAQLHTELDRIAGQALTVPERPRAYNFGLALPTNALGKRIDWPVAQVASPPPC